MSKQLITSGTSDTRALSLQIDELTEQLTNIVKSTLLSQLINETTVVFDTQETKVLQAGLLRLIEDRIETLSTSIILQAPTVRIEGDLIVTNNTTTASSVINLDATKLNVKDPIIVINTAPTDNPTSDIGIVFSHIDPNQNTIQGFVGFNTSRQAFQVVQNVVAFNENTNNIDDSRNVLGALEAGQLTVARDVLIGTNAFRYNYASNVATLGNVAFSPDTATVTNPNVLVQNNNVVVSGNVACSQDISGATIHTGGLSARTAVVSDISAATLFAGQAEIADTINARAFTTQCDARLKQDIEDVDVAKALDVIERLRVKRYRYRADAGDRRHVGFLAQEVREVMPDVVTADASGILRLEKDGIYAAAVAAIQELSARVRRQDAVIEALVRRLGVLESRCGGAI